VSNKEVSRAAIVGSPCLASTPEFQNGVPISSDSISPTPKPRLCSGSGEASQGAKPLKADKAVDDTIKMLNRDEARIRGWLLCALSDLERQRGSNTPSKEGIEGGRGSTQSSKEGIEGGKTGCTQPGTNAPPGQVRVPVLGGISEGPSATRNRERPSSCSIEDVKGSVRVDKGAAEVVLRPKGWTGDAGLGKVSEEEDADEDWDKELEIEEQV
jgi:hypothetical protein